MKPLIRRMLMLAMNSAGYRWIMTHIIPNVRFSMAYAQFSGREYHKAYALLQPGDIILTRDPWKLTGLMTPGWDHAELFIGKGGEYETIGMHIKGLVKSYFFDVAKESQDIMIFRCRDSISRSCANINAFNLIHLNEHQPITYDLSFTLGAKSLYCFELIKNCYPRIKFDLSDALCLGFPYLSAQGIIENENFEVIYDSTLEEV